MVDHQTHSDEKDGCNLPEVLKLRGDGTGLVANTSDKCRRCQRCTLICSMGNGAKLTVQGEYTDVRWGTGMNEEMVRKRGRNERSASYLWRRAHVKILFVESGSIYAKLVAVKSAGSGLDEFQKGESKHLGLIFYSRVITFVMESIRFPTSLNAALQSIPTPIAAL